MITRRDFLSAGGIVVVLVNDLEAQESGRGRRGFGRAMPKEVSAWLHIGEDGAITAYTGKVEVGQNSRTSLTQAVAEELGAQVDGGQVSRRDGLVEEMDVVPPGPDPAADVPTGGHPEMLLLAALDGLMAGAHPPSSSRRSSSISRHRDSTSGATLRSRLASDVP